MKILQVITLCELGGAQSVVVNLANSLVKEHEVIVVAGVGDGKMWSLLHPSVKRESVPSLQRTLSPVNEIRTIVALRKIYRKYKPDVIHLHSSKVGILGRVAFPKSKTVYTVHGFDSIRIAYRKFLPLEKLLQYKCSAIVGVSNYDELNLRSEGITRNVGVVYNGIERPEALREIPFQELKEYKKKVLCIARLSPQKKIDLFLEVAALLPQYAFIWIGNQYEYKETYPQNVYFMGNLPNAGAYNEYADLFVLTSNYEGLPMVILEAMSFGKPVVASDVGGISEIVENDVNGYTVRNEAQEFAVKISHILENQDVYELFSQNALRRFEKDLTVGKMVRGYMDIYQSNIMNSSIINSSDK